MKFINGPVNWGIIGCGNVCEVKSGPAFSKIENSTLAAVMRRNIEKAKDFAQRHQVSSYYSEANLLVKDPSINAVYIATPPAFHEAYAIMAMREGKAVYIEKPVAMDSAACIRMIEAAHQFNVPVTGAYYRRALPLFRKVKELIQQNVIGTVRLIKLSMQQSPTNNIIANSEENWRIDPVLSGGGLFHDLAPHQLDILYWIFGSPIDVHGFSYNQRKLYEAPDVTTIQAIFQNEILFTGLWAFNVAAQATEDVCMIMGDRGVLKFSFFRNSLLEVATDTHDVYEFPTEIHIQQPMIQNVVAFFRGEAPNPCSLEETLVSMRMMDATL